MKTRQYSALITSALLSALIANAQDAQTYFNDGKKLKEQGRIKEAQLKFSQAVVAKPDYTEALYEWGWCQNDLADYEGAIKNLRKVRSSWNNVAKVHFELGYAFQKSGKTDSAISSYNRCLNLKPDYALALKQLGNIAYEKDDNNTALEQFGKYEAASKVEIKDYLFWYRKGFANNALKDYTNAKTALQQSLVYKSDYINTYLELGFASTKLKQDDEAIGYYKKAIEIDPKNHIPYNGIGEVYRDNKKDMTEAMNWYQKTLSINSMERKGNFGMGYCLNSTGKYNDAITYLKKAIEKEPDYVAAHVELGYSLYKTGMHTEAISSLNQAISLNPKNENSRYYLTLIYVSQKNKEMAQKAVDELKSLSSKHVSQLQLKVDELQ
jgi:tetratricopeptide (TPR) repeat protein